MVTNPAKTSAEKQISIKLQTALPKMNYTEEITGDSTGTGNELVRPIEVDRRPFTGDDGFCFLTRVAGKFEGANESASVELVDNVWTMKLRGGGVQATVRCVYFR